MKQADHVLNLKSISSSFRFRADGQMCPRAIRPPLHRLAAQRGQAEQGLQVRRQEQLRQGRLPGLPQAPLQHSGLQHQQGSHRHQQEAVPEDAVPDALQTYGALISLRRLLAQGNKYTRYFSSAQQTGAPTVVIQAPKGTLSLQ